MNILHISDLHFPTKLNPFVLKKKSLVGYTNYLIRRKKKHCLHEILVQSILNSEYDCLVISGDITNVSAEREFKEARRILKPILDSRAFVIPGNHDRYTLESLEKRYFENYFGEFIGDTIPGVNDIEFYIRWKDFGGIRLFGWDSNLLLPSMQAQGFINPEVARKSLQFIDKSGVKDYMVVCHHPIWNPEDRQESDNHRLLNRDEILEILCGKPPIAYFHGHLHTNWVKEPEKDIPFFILNSASSTRISDARHESGYHSLYFSGGVWNYRRLVYNNEKKNFIENSNTKRK